MKLILSVAVNCNEKEQYITQIMEMEESIQQNIYKALQDIGPSSARNSLNLSNSDFRDDGELLAQKLHEKENLIALILEEKNTLTLENQKLQNALERYENPALIGDDGASLGPALQGSVRMNEMRKQVENLRNDLALSENAKEDLKMKTIQQESEYLNGKLTKIVRLNLNLWCDFFQK